MAKYLPDLLTILDSFTIRGNQSIQIEHIAYDSRKVLPGSLFICLGGSHVDGHDFAAAAVEKGAVAVLAEREICLPQQAALILVADTRAAMQQIVPRFFDYPSRSLRMIGITGTNGKTTTSYLIRSILRAAGYKVGLIGTIQTMIEEQVLPVKNTTPDVLDLQETLQQMVAAGLDYAVMEVSSHALALGRVAGCEFDVGVFSNLTQDHLDFHKTLDQYAAAKAKLFELLSRPGQNKPGKTAVINLDDAAAGVMISHAACPVISYAINDATAAIKASDIRITAKGASFEVGGSFGRQRLSLKLTGDFNVYNAMAAIGAAIAENVSLSTIVAALENADSVPGRFELVDAGQPFSVVVDYAHTPDGLENVLQTARRFTTGRVIVVFGCGGDRDRSKRPIMGSLAAQYGEVVIATSDNPRSEDPAAILQEVEAGIKAALRPGGVYQVIVDRREAIARALHLAQPEDVVLIAGKGHETYQILKDETIDFDDREVVRQCIREMK
ncbi:MAG: UDP-N-acetylmuramoyl-L-alanyl-D-glutamate--2,6-diaminopimelate ligase [Sporomusaceae bacterium]|nr:UDP-N-acetylmuramoyl-L-alanyl-D-glutamate--2,6-diaminopimelate ligase [Sporomusaceae bacterium]